MERIKRSWELVKASLEVLKQDKELILFPIISAMIMFFVTLTFLIPTLLGNILDGIFVNGMPIFGYIVLFLFYLVQYTVVYFNSTALVGAAMIRLRGGDPKVKDGISIAWSHILPILGWALVSATVGLILNALSNNSKKRGRGGKSLIASLLGAAWNVLTFLVVPVLAVEGLGPIEAIKRSWELLKSSWGEQISGKLSIGLIFGLIGIGGGLLLAGAGIGLSILLESIIPAIIFGIVLFLFIMILSLLNSTLSSIFSAAVYAYAAEGQTGMFDENLIQESIYS
ncbi:MAG: DUF6159 family protein [Brevefilum sp.]|nr:DUF6159 family protein [Brevefilum sp.]